MDRISQRPAEDGDGQDSALPVALAGLIGRAAALAALLGAAPPAPAQTSAGAPAVIEVPAGVQQRQVRFSRFRTLLRDGDTVGEIRVGDSCGSLTRLIMNPRTEQAIMSPALRAVREELGRAGYKDPTRAPQRLFEEDNEAAGPDLLLGGMLEEFRTSYCSSGSGARTDGWVRMKVRWELYDVAERKVVHAKT